MARRLAHSGGGGHALLPGANGRGTTSADDDDDEPVRDLYGFIVPSSHIDLYVRFKFVCEIVVLCSYVLCNRQFIHIFTWVFKLRRVSDEILGSTCFEDASLRIAIVDARTLHCVSHRSGRCACSIQNFLSLKDLCVCVFCFALYILVE